MSFILDALRKSENKRHDQHPDAVTSVYEAPVPKSQKKRWWVFVLGCVLALNLMLVLWLVMHWQQPVGEVAKFQDALPQAEHAPPPARSEATERKEMAEASGPAAIDRPADVMDPEPAAATRNARPEEASPPADAITPELRTRQQAPVTVPMMPAREEQSSAPRPDIAVETGSESRLTPVNKLPTSLRARVSGLDMPLHAYNANNTAASLVQISGRLLRAGDHIGDDLVIEEITAEGAILRSGDYRFLLPRRGQ